jgi:hypothetical protein
LWGYHHEIKGIKSRAHALLLLLPLLPPSLSPPLLPFPSHFHLATSSSPSPSSSSLLHPKNHTRHSAYSSTLILVVGDITPSPPHPAFVVEIVDFEPLYARYTSCDQQKQLELDSGDQTRTTIDNDLDYLCQL